MQITAAQVKKELQALASKERAEKSKRFFKTGEGQYAESDQFCGVTVPDQRKVAKRYRDLPLPQIDQLLTDPIHEYRLTALFIVVDQFSRSLKSSKKDPNSNPRLWVDFLLSRTKHINNWDLVDSCAYQILGAYLLTMKERSLLDTLAKSANLWEQRLAIVATKALIREGEFNPTLKLAKKFLSSKQDLIHKAVGWMLREVGEQELSVLLDFLDDHAAKMPRTMLRYAIEKLTSNQRKLYLEQR